VSLNVALYLFPEIEVLDFAGPYEVFTTASRVAQRQGGEAPFRVFSVARRQGVVKARAGLGFAADYSLDEHPPVDLLIVPGGVVDGERRDPLLLDWLRRSATTARLVASVCTGAFLLGDAGLLGQRATTHREDQADLQREFPELIVETDKRWVEDGKVVTSGGISAGIDMSLHLVERLSSRKLAEATARQMEYRWQD
jgi:transcriptional regulator GlxA family with amidase domain